MILFKIAVILFVRMWVEICHFTELFHWQHGHPLREDVSWNIPPCLSATLLLLSSSSWGCELKYLNQKGLYRPHIVILFVRMWVEMRSCVGSLRSAHCHPLREDVSWNIRPQDNNVVHVSSSSSWGCELKSRSSLGYTIIVVILFVRMWVEMLIVSETDARIRHPLREDVSWNSWWNAFERSVKWSSSSWGCELKCIKQVTRRTTDSHPLREDVSWNTWCSSRNIS